MSWTVGHTVLVNARLWNHLPHVRRAGPSIVMHIVYVDVENRRLYLLWSRDLGMRRSTFHRQIGCFCREFIPTGDQQEHGFLSYADFAACVHEFSFDSRDILSPPGMRVPW